MASTSSSICTTRVLLTLVGMAFVVSMTALAIAAASDAETSGGSKTGDSTSTNNHHSLDNVTTDNVFPTHHPDDEHLLLYHFDETPSTQDEAKIIADELASQSSLSSSTSSLSSLPSFCVTATMQTNGRGTSGRQWLGAPGNVFVTIGIPQAAWRALKSRTTTVPLTLLPLKIGEVTAHFVNWMLTNDDVCRRRQSDVVVDAKVTVKWPNDILVDEKKISGTLIESSSRGDYFLIGIGINVAYAPLVPTSGPNHGRTATSLRDHCEDNKDDYNTGREDSPRQWGIQLAYTLHKWIVENASTTTAHVDTAQAIVDGWKQWLDWDMELVMRDTPDRERVKLVNVLPDGQVEVVNINKSDNGHHDVAETKRTLVSDYFL